MAVEGERQHTVEGEVRLAPTLVFSHAIEVDKESKNIIGGAVDIKADLGVAAMITSYKRPDSQTPSEEELKARANKLTEFVSQITGNPRQVTDQFEDQLPQLLQGGDFSEYENYSVVKKIDSGDNTYVIVASFGQSVESLSGGLNDSNSLIKTERILRSNLTIFTYEFQPDNQIIISSGRVRFPDYNNKYLENVPSEDLAQVIMMASVSEHLESVNRHLQKKEKGEYTWTPEPLALNILAVDFTKKEVKAPVLPEKAEEQKKAPEIARSIADNYERAGGPDYPQLFSDIKRLIAAGLNPDYIEMLKFLGSDPDMQNKWVEEMRRYHVENNSEEIERYMTIAEALGLEKHEDFVETPPAAPIQPEPTAPVKAWDVDVSNIPPQPAWPLEPETPPAPIGQPVPPSEVNVSEEWSRIMDRLPEVKERAKPMVDVGSASEKKPGAKINEDLVYVDLGLKVAAIFDGEGGVDVANVAKEALVDYFRQKWQLNPDMKKVLAYIDEQINNKDVTGATSASIVSLVNFDELSRLYTFEIGNFGKSMIYVCSKYDQLSQFSEYSRGYTGLPGEMLILGSEGIKNLTHPKIEEIIHQGNENNWSANKISQELVKAASAVGKPSDISAIVIKLK